MFLLVATNSNPCGENINWANRRLAVSNLKLCPVCDALNSVLNKECFVCRWRGAFVSGGNEIEQALSDLMRRCPDYSLEHLPFRPFSEEAGRLPKWRLLLRRVLQGPLDFTV